MAQHVAVMAERNEAVAQRDATIAERDHTIRARDLKIDKLAFELASLRRMQFGAKSESLDSGQLWLFEEAKAEDIAAIEAALEALQEETGAPIAKAPHRKPVRRPLPEDLRRETTVHTPDQCDCAACGAALVKIGEHASGPLLRILRSRHSHNRHPLPLVAGDRINSSWSIDFMSDALWDGRRFRTFNVMDDFSREAPAIEVDLNLPATRVIRTLERIAAWRGYPTRLRLDNGPEFIALTLAEWAERKGIVLGFIEPGRPMQNGFVERFNGSFRRGVLDMHVFRHLTEVREHAERWVADYNNEIPHDSLDGLTPAEFRAQNDPATSYLAWY